MLLATTASAILMLLQQAPAEGTDWDAEFGVETKERDPVTGEIPVEPYEQSNANAGAAPYDSDGLVAAFWRARGHCPDRRAHHRTVRG